MAMQVRPRSRASCKSDGTMGMYLRHDALEIKMLCTKLKLGSPIQHGDPVIFETQFCDAGARARRLYVGEYGGHVHAPCDAQNHGAR